MNLKNMTAEQMDDFAFLPEEAIAALQAGEEWEHQPESIDGADADVYFCDDCDEETWHLVWTVFGLRLDREGNLYETEWTVDSDGDWSCSDEYAYATHDHAKAYEGVRARFREYAEWVIENGRDPINEFSRTHAEPPEVFTVAVFPHGNDAVVVPGWQSLPERAREFLEVDGEGVIRCLGGLPEFRERAAFVTWLDANVFRFEVNGARRESTKREITAQAEAWLAREEAHVAST